MKLRNAVGALAATLALGATTVADAADWYVKAEVGTTVNSELNTSFGSLEQGDGPTFGGGVGADFGPFSVEGTVRHESGDIDLGFVNVQTDVTYADATVLADLPFGVQVGAGPTYGQGEMAVGPFQGDDSGWGYHGLARLNFGDSGFYAQGRYTDVDMEHVDANGADFTVGYRHTF